ncbi:MAG: hypothetical protein BWY73_00226 [candidate division TA06 bacterium ADurb.Bin417]|uniref:Uncharacterized protein n=1 Tax=candidate division TA06 bacterium ADurb.Bin417 TaxID=1852828 RepID=A0A1V5MK26_UNCT6|nr:MAG: hypothetical protein BWY73_00226 [candidate division TA06 bacterium ADurb.Bin417]
MDPVAAGVQAGVEIGAVGAGVAGRDQVAVEVIHFDPHPGDGAGAVGDGAADGARGDQDRVDAVGRGGRDDRDRVGILDGRTVVVPLVDVAVLHEENPVIFGGEAREGVVAQGVGLGEGDLEAERTVEVDVDGGQRAGGNVGDGAGEGGAVDQGAVDGGGRRGGHRHRVGGRKIGFAVIPTGQVAAAAGLEVDPVNAGLEVVHLVEAVEVRLVRVDQALPGVVDVDRDSGDRAAGGLVADGAFDGPLLAQGGVDVFGGLRGGDGYGVGQAEVGPVVVPFAQVAEEEEADLVLAAGQRRKGIVSLAVGAAPLDGLAGGVVKGDRDAGQAVAGGLVGYPAGDAAAPEERAVDVFDGAGGGGGYGVGFGETGFPGVPGVEVAVLAELDLEVGVGEAVLDDVNRIVALAVGLGRVPGVEGAAAPADRVDGYRDAGQRIAGGGVGDPSLDGGAPGQDHVPGQDYLLAVILDQEGVGGGQVGPVLPEFVEAAGPLAIEPEAVDARFQVAQDEMAGVVSGGRIPALAVRGVVVVNLDAGHRAAAVGDGAGDGGGRVEQDVAQVGGGPESDGDGVGRGRVGTVQVPLGLVGAVPIVEGDQVVARREAGHLEVAVVVADRPPGRPPEELSVGLVDLDLDAGDRYVAEGILDPAGNAAALGQLEIGLFQAPFFGGGVHLDGVGSLEGILAAVPLGGIDAVEEVGLDLVVPGLQVLQGVVPLEVGFGPALGCFGSRRVEVHLDPGQAAAVRTGHPAVDVAAVHLFQDHVDALSMGAVGDGHRGRFGLAGRVLVPLAVEAGALGVEIHLVIAGRQAGQPVVAVIVRLGVRVTPGLVLLVGGNLDAGYADAGSGGDPAQDGRGRTEDGVDPGRVAGSGYRDAGGVVETGLVVIPAAGIAGRVAAEIDPVVAAGQAAGPVGAAGPGFGLDGEKAGRVVDLDLEAGQAVGGVGDGAGDGAAAGQDGVDAAAEAALGHRDQLGAVAAGRIVVPLVVVAEPGGREGDPVVAVGQAAGDIVSVGVGFGFGDRIEDLVLEVDPHLDAGDAVGAVAGHPAADPAAGVQHDVLRQGETAAGGDGQAGGDAREVTVLVNFIEVPDRGGVELQAVGAGRHRQGEVAAGVGQGAGARTRKVVVHPVGVDPDAGDAVGAVAGHLAGDAFGPGRAGQAQQAWQGGQQADSDEFGKKRPVTGYGWRFDAGHKTLLMINLFKVWI